MNVGIIGLGLMGASFGKTLIKKTNHVVYGSDISELTMVKAELLSCITYRLTESDYAKLDILVIAVYPRAFEEVLNATLPRLKSGATVIDLGGIKRPVVAAMERAKKQREDIQFVATHPMAGREFWGVDHSVSGLYEKSSVLLMPVHTDIESLTMLKGVLLEIGVTDVVVTDAARHDEIIAYTSQLAHLLSSSYIKSPTAAFHDGYSAGSFRDLTRVAKLNATMWTELMTDNSDNLVKEVDVLIQNLTDYRDALSKKDEDKLFSLLSDGNAKKETIEKSTRAYKKNV